MTDEFHKYLLNLYERARDEEGYNATRFKVMLDQHGGVGAAKRLLDSPVAQSGLTHLWELQRPDLSVGQAVLNSRFSSLFTEEDLATARKRLEDLEFNKL